MADERALTVTEAMNAAKKALEGVYARVVGEVSEFNDKPGYKAAYFTVSDGGASMPCLMWRDQYLASGVELHCGMLVELSGSFSAYIAKGRMQFAVRSLALAGEGNLRLQVAQLARKLELEGLMRPERKRALPRYPQRIAVVTSPRGKAVHDVIRTLRRRYPLAELLLDATLAGEFEGGQYATIRLTAGMYHRFHAPADCIVEAVRFVAGDVWNVNPPALDRVPRLYCRNERAIVQCRLVDGSRMLLVPVAAVLVASLKLHCLQERLHLRYRGPTRLRCRARYARGQELGWFEQGSTIIVLRPGGFRPADGVATGARLRMGCALFRS